MINDEDINVDDGLMHRKVRESRQELRRFMREVKRGNPTAKAQFYHEFNNFFFYLIMNIDGQDIIMSNMKVI